MTQHHPGTRPEMPDTDTIFSWISDLATFSGRGTQTLDDRRSADYLVDAFTRFGLSDIQVQEADSLHWHATRSELTVAGTPVPHAPAAFSHDTGIGPFSTGADGLTASIVDVGDGGEGDFAAADVRGKIVLFNLRFTLPRSLLLAVGEFFHDPHDTVDPADMNTANPYLSNFEEVLELAIGAGAVGFVGVLADYFDSHDIRPEYTEDITIPGLWVTKANGARIRDLAVGGARATLCLEGEKVTTPARTVIGYLPGASDDTIMVQSHHDSAWDGGVEDASGTAEVMALARYYSQLTPQQRPKTLMFVLMDSHFTGYQAHEEFVDTFITNPATSRRIVANVTLEHIAKQAEIGPDGSLVVYDRPEYRGIFENVSAPLKAAIENAVITHGLHRTLRVPADPLAQAMGELPTDADLVHRAGIPIINLISGPLYLYDKADTIDKVHKPDLVPVALAFADIIDHLAVTPSDQIHA
ncbi:M28 family peptidase [Kitasatospora cineracea]|uniref:Peptidase M28-like protein n=1 Tax=Kitasatospora cineracea TaxID=88074 RepID=A0A8G1UP77_9ACTN|nr:M28 family peptidase [Kitasatospora cineracea]ROR46514.1 peptidase M28-like protein [Kitasatospora cineracea]